MITIWKFPLKVEDRQRISLPFGAELLSVQMQHDKPCLWARVHTDQPLEDRVIFTQGTGNPIPEGAGRFIGTYQLNGGNLVFHVFDSKVKKMSHYRDGDLIG